MAKFPGTAEVRVSAKTQSLVHAELVFGDVAGNYTIPVKAGTFVYNIGTNVQQGFDGGPTLTVGDSANAAGFLTNANIALATASTPTAPAIKNSTAFANPYQNGKYYPANDNIIFAFVPGTSPTVGDLKAFVVMSQVANDGLSA